MPTDALLPPILAEVSWGWVAFLLAAGIVLAVAEVFIPSGGLLTLLSVAAFVAAVVMGFVIGPTAGIVTLLATVLFAPLLIYVLMRIWPHTPLARRIILSGPASKGTAGDLVRERLDDLVGREGQAKTLLRPSGKVVVDGRTVDCVTEGQYVRPGTKVRVLAVRGARVLVRPMDPAETEGAGEEAGRPPARP